MFSPLTFALGINFNLSICLNWINVFLSCWLHLSALKLLFTGPVDWILKHNLPLFNAIEYSYIFAEWFPVTLLPIFRSQREHSFTVRHTTNLSHWPQRCKRSVLAGYHFDRNYYIAFSTLYCVPPTATLQIKVSSGINDSSFVIDRSLYWVCFTALVCGTEFPVLLSFYGNLINYSAKVFWISIPFSTVVDYSSNE